MRDSRIVTTKQRTLQKSSTETLDVLSPKVKSALLRSSHIQSKFKPGPLQKTLTKTASKDQLAKSVTRPIVGGRPSFHGGFKMGEKKKSIQVHQRVSSAAAPLVEKHHHRESFTTALAPVTEHVDLDIYNDRSLKYTTQFKKSETPSAKNIHSGLNKIVKLSEYHSASKPAHQNLSNKLLAK